MLGPGHQNTGFAKPGFCHGWTEEALKLKLQQLEKLAFDPKVSGRQEEIWARMSVIRERAQLLKTETDKLANDASASGGEGPLDEEQMKKVEKVSVICSYGSKLILQILSSYEMQLGQLKRERDSAEKDFDDWQASTQTGVGIRRL